MSTPSKEHGTQRDPQAREVFPVYCFLEDLTDLPISSVLGFKDKEGE
jgi:hypothetical protein